MPTRPALDTCFQYSCLARRTGQDKGSEKEISQWDPHTLLLNPKPCTTLHPRDNTSTVSARNQVSQRTPKPPRKLHGRIFGEVVGIGNPSKIQDLRQQGLLQGATLTITITLTVTIKGVSPQVLCRSSG